MNKRVLSVGLAVLGFVSLVSGKAYSAAGTIGIVKEELPTARIEVTGVGYPPHRHISESQKRLLAQRSAIVDAYRVMSAVLRGVSGYVVGGSGFLQTSGYIRGAEVRDIRYYINGKVEVDLVLPVNFAAREVNRRVDWDGVITDISNRGYRVYYNERQVRQISEEEWLNLRK